MQDVFVSTSPIHSATDAASWKTVLCFCFELEVVAGYVFCCLKKTVFKGLHSQSFHAIMKMAVICYIMKHDCLAVIGNVC